MSYRRFATVIAFTAVITTAVVTPAATTALTALPDTPVTTVALALVEAEPAAAHYGHHCGSGTHTYILNGRTWRDRLIRDEGTRHLYRTEIWFDYPWYVIRRDGWYKKVDTYRTCGVKP